MHPLVYLMLITGSACLAQFRGGYDTRHLIERDEPQNEIEGQLVECPVCENSGNWMSIHEECPIVRGNKRYKKCQLGTYINTVCGNRLDCFRGPRERCTEKMEFDIYGQRCAPGYYCNKNIGLCTGMDFPVNSNVQWRINPHRYPLRAHRDY